MVDRATHVRNKQPLHGSVRDTWTAADLATLPDDGLRDEIIDGTLRMSPAPTLIHQDVPRELTKLMSDRCPGHLRVYFAPVDWQPTDTTSPQPDLLVVRRSDVTVDRLIGTTQALCAVSVMTR